MSTTFIYVRLVPNLNPGTRTGSISLTSNGASSKNIPVTGRLYLEPTIIQPAHQTFKADSTTNPISFTGIANVYRWTNSNPAIGLPANGVGYIPAFTAVNPGTTSETATITVTPESEEYAYIANTGSNSVSVVNVRTHAVLTTIDVASSPYGVTVNSSGTRAYVSGSNPSSVHVINTANNSVSSTIPLSQSPNGLIISPDESKLYVAGQNSIFVIEAGTNSITASIPVGTTPEGVTINHDGSKVYVANSGSNSVSVINTHTNTVSATIPVGDMPRGIAISPDGQRIYVANGWSHSVSVINTQTNSVISQVNVGTNPYGVAVSPDGSRVYVTNPNSKSVSVINTTTLSVTATITGIEYPYGISVSSDGAKILVASTWGYDLTVIHASSNSVSSRIKVGFAAYSLGNFITAGIGCTGTPATFTITVNPNPTVKATIDAGILRACLGSPSAAPNLRKVLLEGSSLTHGIIARVTEGFEISKHPEGSFVTMLEFSPSNGKVENTTLYIRSAASSNTGGKSGTIVLTSVGSLTHKFSLDSWVYPDPDINKVANKQALADSLIEEIRFSGAANHFSWTNSEPGIGLAASGNGNIPAFTALNDSENPVTATITVTPERKEFAYIPDPGSNTVKVYATESKLLVSTIQVGSNPYAVAVSPNTSLAYVSNSSSGNVSVINTANNRLETSIAVGTTPKHLVLNHDGSQLYVVNNSSSSISVINTHTNTVDTTIRVGSNPEALVLSPGGDYAYVTNLNSNSVSVINTATHTVTTTIPVSQRPMGITISPDGQYVYVANSGSTSVSVINTATQQIIHNISFAYNPRMLASSLDGSAVYVTHSGSNFISVINTSTQRIERQITVGSEPWGLATSIDGAKLFVSNRNSRSISVINTNTNTLIDNLTLGFSPTANGNFIGNGIGCTGSPTTFTITVQPAPPIRTTMATGVISTCVGTASASSQTQQFIVSGGSLSEPVQATAPAGFEISTNREGHYASQLLLLPVSRRLANTTIYVRAAATAPIGAVLGYVELTTAGAPLHRVAVRGRVYGIANVDEMPDIRLVANTSTQINFKGTANIYQWTNSNPAISQPANSTNRLGESGVNTTYTFTATNTSDKPIESIITVTPKTEQIAYVASNLFHYVIAFNTATNRRVGSIDVGGVPTGLTVSPDGQRVYVANNYSNDVSVIDAGSNTVLTTIKVGVNPYGIVVNPYYNRVYVVNSKSNNVSVINTETNTVISTIAVGEGPLGVAISPDGLALYVTNFESSSISVIDTRSNTVIDTIPFIEPPRCIAVSPDGKRLYAAGWSRGVAVIDTKTRTVLTYISSGHTPYAIAVSPDSKKVYVTNHFSHTTSIIDAETNKKITELKTGNRPMGVSVSPDGKKVFVTCYNYDAWDTRSNTFFEIDPVTNTIKNSFALGSGGSSIGNFISVKTGCEGPPMSFKVIVDPAVPAIVADRLTGNITSCYGTPSSSPNYQSFMVHGSNLKNSITIQAPEYFEVSTSQWNGFTNTVTLPVNVDKVDFTQVYVRSAGTAPAGTHNGNIVLTSADAKDVSLAVQASISTNYELMPASLPEATINQPYNVTITGASQGYTYSASGLPEGMHMSHNGVISGSPKGISSSPVNVQIKALGACEQTFSYPLTVHKITQQIDFPTIADMTTESDSYPLEARTSSGLPVSFEIVSGPASISQSVLYLTRNAGEVKVRAFNNGTTIYAPVSTEQTFTVHPVLSSSTPLSLEVNIYPNPSKGIVTIELPSALQGSSLELFDGVGRIIWSHPGDISKTLTITNLGRGLYILRVSGSKGNISKRIVII